MAVALLLYDFQYGDFIRWMGGPYTHSHRNWDDTFAALEAVADAKPPPGFPIPDYDRTYRLATEGAPLQGIYGEDTTYASLAQRNLRPPTPALLEEAPAIHEKLCKEEQLSYHVLLPRFLWHFIYSLHICLLTFVRRHNDPKGRLCVDPSSTLGPDDTANTNRYIPDPGTPGHLDENPPIFYGTAFMRYLTWIWNLRISYAREDIIQQVDDISAAFHRALYHPAMAVLFASVWENMLVIPVGIIFGARNSPSLYMLKGELRAHYAHHVPKADSLPLTQLVTSIELGPEPSSQEIAEFSQAMADSQHQGIINPEGPNPERRLASFVDDSGTAHA